jgi:hypothetical protein
MRSFVILSPAKDLEPPLSKRDHSLTLRMTGKAEKLVDK